MEYSPHMFFKFYDIVFLRISQQGNWVVKASFQRYHKKVSCAGVKQTFSSHAFSMMVLHWYSLICGHLHIL